MEGRVISAESGVMREVAGISGAVIGELGLAAWVREYSERRIFISVVLPAPFTPTRPALSPVSRRKPVSS